MRRIDKLLGIPLCFILTQIHRLFFFAIEAKPPRNILFIELSEMGSTILADPAMRKARRETGAELYFVIFKSNVGSLGFLNTIPADNIFTIRNDSLLGLLSDTLRFLLWTRKKNIDTVIDLELFSRFTALLSGLCGAANRVGFYRFHNEGLYRGELLTHKVAYNPHIHIAKNFVALVNALLSPVVQVPYSKTVIEDAEIILQKAHVEESAKRNMRDAVTRLFPAYDETRHRIVLLNPNASEMLPQRRWPNENFAFLASKILERWEEVIIVVTGSHSERQETEQLIERTQGNARMVNFAGGCSLQELAALYGIAEVMVTNDSGPGHFSSITDMPSIVLYGPETPQLYGSLGKSEALFAGLACSPCVSASNHRKTACTQPLCMQAITPEHVLERLSFYL